MTQKSLTALLKEVKNCRLCEDSLEHGVRPVVQLAATSRILIAGQAPGRRVHESGVPFDDPSGDRLRSWMGVTKEVFYDPTKIAILPMGFCYPGTGVSGDLAPRPECADAWRESLMAELGDVKLTLVIGQYALRWHLETGRESLTATVKNWKEHRPAAVPLPHPSPRNNIWLRKNPWFAEEVLPYLQRRVKMALR
jgi:uracil-DNA glycosylase